MGCSRGDRRPAMGSLSVVEAVSVNVLVGWLSAFRDAVHEHGAVPHRARLGDRGRGPRGQPDPRHGRGAGGRDALASRERRRPVQEGRHDAGDLGRRRERPAVRHVLPPDGDGCGGRSRAGRSGSAGLAAGGSRGDRGARQGRGRGQDDVRRAGAGTRCVLPSLDSGASVADAARAAASAAADGRDATEPMQALKGRASYLGERSVGHLDPGAASSALLVAALADALS